MSKRETIRIASVEASTRAGTLYVCDDRSCIAAAPTSLPSIHISSARLCPPPPFFKFIPLLPSPSHLRTTMYVHSSPLLSPLLTSSPGHLICLVPRPRRRRPSSPRSCSTWPSLASNSVFSPSFVLSSPQSINHDHIYPPRGEFASFPQWCGVGRA